METSSLSDVETEKRAVRRGSRSLRGGSRELARQPGDVPSLKPHQLQLILAGLTLATAACYGCRAVGRAACYFVDPHLRAGGIGQSHDHHPEVQQVGDNRQQRSLLAAVLCRRRSKGASDLSDQRIA